MHKWIVTIRNAFASQLWPWPAMAVVVAVILGLALPGVEAVVHGRLSERVSGWLFSGDADTARSFLSAISSSLVNVTALTFSLTVVTLQLASSQFSPRLLRIFTSDKFVQGTLALFLATFTYSLTVLRSVRGADETGEAEFVPRIAVTLAFVLAIASVMGLVLFLSHITAQIRVETMLRNVHREASTTMRAMLPERDHTTSADRAPVPPSDAMILNPDYSGFLIWVAENELLNIAVSEEAVITLDVYPGSFMVRGTPLGSAWPLEGGAFDEETAERIAKRVLACVHTGFERTAYQDVGYGLRQLADVSIKALSPGVNDPTTAVHALGHISAFLCELTDRELGAEFLRDEEDQVRVTMWRPDFATYVDIGISQSRRYGAADPRVMERIFEVLLNLSHRVHAVQRSVVLDQLERLRSTVGAQSFDPMEKAALIDLGLRIEENLREPRPSTRTS